MSRLTYSLVTDMFPVKPLITDHKEINYNNSWMSVDSGLTVGIRAVEISPS